MMQADTQLHEAFVGVFLLAALDADRRAGADVIAEFVAVKDTFHAKEGQQAAIEFPRLVELAHGQNNVGHAIDINHLGLLSCLRNFQSLLLRRIRAGTAL